MKYTAVIADDEALLRAKLRRYLQEVQWVDLVAETADGLSTVGAVDDLRPDLLFLDVRMPGMSGIEVVERLQHRPTIVFTTAYDEYAVAAFELRAIDYLLKTFGRARFDKALSRVKETLDAGGARETDRALEALRRDGRLARLFVRTGDGVVAISLSEVLRFEARDDYVAIHTADRRYLASLRMDALERVLEPRQYLRIHRSHMVSLDHVESIKRHRSGRFEITMDDGTRLFASRARSRALRKLIV